MLLIRAKKQHFAATFHLASVLRETEEGEGFFCFQLEIGYISTQGMNCVQIIIRIDGICCSDLF